MKNLNPLEFNTANAKGTTELSQLGLLRVFAGDSNLRFLAILAGVTLAPLVSQAVPSYARQHDVSCTACHTEFPILTEMGRTFKLNGYTMSADKTELPPLALMVQPSFTQTNKGQPGGAATHYHDNSNFALDQVSVFYAGRLFGPYAEKLFGADAAGFLNKFGTFIQTTYSGVDDVFSWDNAELRYSDNGMIGDKPVTYGFYLNNNPGMQDPWNAMPAWGFPFSGSALAPTPRASTLIEGGLAQQVLGLGGYMMLSNSFYLDLGAYHTLGSRFQNTMGVDPTDETQVPGLAPYWRAAYTKSSGNQSYEIGLFGMAASTYPGRDSSAGKDHIMDWGIDSQYQVSFDKHDITGLLSCIYEDQNWDASKKLESASNSSDHLWAFKATVDYLYDKTYGGAIGYFLVNGSHDELLYSDNANGSPLSDGLVLQLNWMPLNKGGGPDFWPRSNVKFSLQYVIYNRFDGSRNNYDGSGRDASANNTLYLQAWMAL